MIRNTTKSFDILAFNFNSLSVLYNYLDSLTKLFLNQYFYSSFGYFSEIVFSVVFMKCN